MPLALHGTGATRQPFSKVLYFFVMKGDTEVILFISFFICGVLFANFIEERAAAYLLNLMIAPVATLAAAYFGAGYAFRLQSMKEASTAVTTNLKHGNGTIFRLLTLQNKLLNYQAQALDPVREKDAIFLRLKPSAPMSKDEFDLDLDGLSFLFGHEPNLIGELHVCISKYQAAIDAINSRSDIHFNRIQPALSAAGFEQGRNISLPDIKAAVGEMNFVILQDATDQLIEIVDDSTLFIGNTIDKLSAALSELFAGREVLSRVKI